MKIVFMGTPTFSVPILEGLIKHHEVCMVVCQPDKQVGRKKILVYPPTKEVALAHGIPVFQPIKLKEDYQPILDMSADVIITAAYGQFVPTVLLNAPKYKAINVHGSLLPKYRGGAPIHKALIDGETTTGITIMYMDKKMDAGDILTQASTVITPDDDVETLHTRLSVMGRDLLLETLKNIEHVKPIKQDESKVTFAYTIKRDEERIDFDQPAHAVLNFIRGMYPWPVAYGVMHDKPYKIHKAHFVKSDAFVPPGTIISLDKEMIVKTQQDAISIDIIQPEGKKAMPIKDFLNGQKSIQVSDAFEKKRGLI